MKETIKAGLILFGALVISRLLPLPPNSEPILGLAVLTPYLYKNNLAFLLVNLLLNSCTLIILTNLVCQEYHAWANPGIRTTK